MKEKMAPIALTLLATLFVLAGLFFLYGAVSSILKTRQAASWPTVPGMLTSVELKRNATSRRPTYQADVRYTYSAGGQPKR